MTDAAVFGNPYNFVPTPPRGDRGQNMPDGLGDQAPAGHHRWHADLLSGEIDVRMTTVTPLLVLTPRPDQVIRRKDNEHPLHQHLDTALAEDADGVLRVDLPISSIRGMLRAAYEMVTNSRYAIFEHPEPPGYRSQVKEAINLAPALVHDDGSVELPGQLVLGRRTFRPVAAVGAWKKAGNQRIWQLDAAVNRQWVEATIVPDNTGLGWQVVTLHLDSHDLPLAATPPAGFRVGGYLHVTGPSIKNKGDERLIITSVEPGQPLTQRESDEPDEPDELIAQLKVLIEHQRSVHSHAGKNDITDRDNQQRPWEYRGHEPGSTAWSRHLYDASTDPAAPTWLGPDSTLSVPAGQPPLPCWYDKQRKQLRPVMVSRLRHKRAADTLLDESLRPAVEPAELSPADRVFGWVAAGTGADSVAYRAQLRITDLTCPQKRAVRGWQGLTLPPLATPKPSQGRFYLGTYDRDDLTCPLGSDVQRAEMYVDGQTLRGRKIYPHQTWMSGLDDGELFKKLRYTPPSTGNGRQRQQRQQRDSQNATLYSWVKQGQEFSFTCRFQDLHPAELGALLWLLTPDRIGCDGKPGYLRLGRGKPFGFGSVRVEAVAVTARTGAQVAERLRTIGTTDETTDTSSLADEFEEAMYCRPALAVMLDAFRRACTGFRSDIRPDYPRERPDGPAYEWFVENDKKAGDKKASSLPTLPKQMDDAR